MSIHDERDLRAQLGAALDDFTPGPFPLSTVVRQGRAAMIRRRIAVAVSVAATGAAAIATPALLHQLSHRSQVPTTPARYHVTLYPPGPGSPRGLIAYGSIDGRRWHATGSRQRQPVNGLCFGAFQMTCQQGGPPRSSRSDAPADFFTSIGSSPLVQIGTVRSDVRYLRVRLSNGQTLTLRPVPLFGRKYASYVAFAVPDAAAVIRISAYSARGAVAYAVPLTAAGSVRTERWLRPGQPASPAPASYKIGSGTAAGHAWSTRLYVGPWGTCFVNWTGGRGNRTGNSYCYRQTDLPLAPGELVRTAYGPLISASTFVAIAQTAPTVSYLILTRADGSTFRVNTVVAGRWRYCEYVTAAQITGRRISKATVVRWAAYDSSGAELGSGRPSGT